MAIASRDRFQAQFRLLYRNAPDLPMPNIAAQGNADRRREEHEVKMSEARFRSYFDLGLIGMAITSPTKGWEDVNDKLCEILGYSRKELVQKSWSELTHPDDLAADVRQFDRV